MPSDVQHSPPIAGERKCLYCAYDLSGLADDTRCPECGRQSIPEAFRREVQEIFDSPRRLYREASRVFSKHPPGWYWSLDRPGDVGRSFRLVFVNVVICVAMLVGAWLLTNAYVLRVVQDTYYDDPTGVLPPLHASRYTFDYGALGLPKQVRYDEFIRIEDIDRLNPNFTYRGVSHHRVKYRGWNLSNWPVCAYFCALLIMTWVLLTQLGMWTQIRRGLPKYARAGRTIMAAGNCESCKLPLQALVIVVWLAVEAAIRLGLQDTRQLSHSVAFDVFLPFAVMVIMASWISPLRSDFTKQLIRSPLHAFRMFIMYVVLFPWPLAGLPVAILAATFGV